MRKLLTDPIALTIAFMAAVVVTAIVTMAVTASCRHGENGVYLGSVLIQGCPAVRR